MKNKIQISIPTPCHENWQNMTVTEKGRFCTSCQKNVVDFTKSSDREILNVFKDNDNLCGRFNDAQLNRELFAPKEKNTIWIAAASGALAFLDLGSTQSNAQLKVKSEHAIPKKVAKELRKITGFVTYDNIPIQNATISVQGTKRNTTSDSNGNFSIQASTGEKLKISFSSMNDTEIIIDDNSQYTVKMDYILAEPPTITCYSYKKIPHTVSTGVVTLITADVEERRKRTFFGRIFHSIGNLFR